ncbi:MAG TPA: iron transporter [Solirubrobacteraceae bacterium]|nr:iron transporter [Solirubrobacteraceae bacterium]
MSTRARSATAAAVAALLLAGCASADKHQSTLTKSSSMAGMNMATGTETAVSGVKPVAIRTLATAYWQDMEIQAQTMTPVAFVVFTGDGRERLFTPPRGAAFHLMVMLTDRHTHFQIPYASVWASITNSSGKLVYNDQQWPMISEYVGTHYGNNVPHLAPGRYTLKLLISPPVSARHLEYRHVWRKQHAVIEHFTWT